MRTKTHSFCFVKDSLNERNVSTFAKFEYERSSSKTEQVFDKTNMISCFFQPSGLEVNFMLKCDQP